MGAQNVPPLTLPSASTKVLPIVLTPGSASMLLLAMAQRNGGEGSGRAAAGRLLRCISQRRVVTSRDLGALPNSIDYEYLRT